MQSENLKPQSLKERCFKFSVAVIKFTNTLPNKRSAWIITDQLIRSATSIGANLVEAKAASSRLEYKKFFEISLKSTNESVYWLELLQAVNLGEEKIVKELIAETQEIGKMIGRSVITLKSKLK